MSEEIIDIEKPQVDESDVSSSHTDEHHHHSHRHHSHRSSHRKSKKKGFKRFYKKHDKVIKLGAAALCLVLIIGIVFLVENIVFNSNDTGYSNTFNSEKDASYKKQLIYIGNPVIQDEVDLLGTVARSYMDSDLSVSVNQIMSQYSDLEERHDVGRCVTLEFDVAHLPTDITVKSAKIEISENSNFDNSVYYNFDKNYSVKFENLKSATKYFYKASFLLSNKKTVIGGGSFKTKSGPRLMNIDGVRNVRDIGGWKTTDNKVIKQGLLYRGTEVDGAVEPTYKLTDKGVKQMVMELGVKYDADLRVPEDSVSGAYIMGANVTHKYYGVGMYGAVFDEGGTDAVKEVFSDLANPDNYPVYLHCTYGCDRTGTVCYILGALLGMNEDDLARDYELSGLFITSLERDSIEVVKNSLQKFDGNSLKEKAENYLLSTGVTYAEIESIRNIFLQDLK